MNILTWFDTVLLSTMIITTNKKLANQFVTCIISFNNICIHLFQFTSFLYIFKQSICEEEKAETNKINNNMQQ